MKLGFLSQVIRGSVILSTFSGNQLCNISTQSLHDLPKISGWRKKMKLRRIFFGYDAAQDHYNVLCLRNSVNEETVLEEQSVLTLGIASEEGVWRTINCSKPHLPVGWRCNLSVNGAIYYLATSKIKEEKQMVLICFDLASEEFSVVEMSDIYFVKNYIHDDKYNGCSMTPVNFKGKLAFAHLRPREGLLELMVLEADHKWSRMSKHIHLDARAWGTRFDEEPKRGCERGQLEFHGTPISGEFFFSYTRTIVVPVAGRFVNSAGFESPIEYYMIRFYAYIRILFEGLTTFAYDKILCLYTRILFERLTTFYAYI